MKNEVWEKIELIFQNALNLPSEDRDSFIQRECAGDDILLSEVGSLLDSFERNSDFLDEPVFEIGLEAISDKPEKDLSGTIIGFYQLEEKIGSGGMGEVYKAVDTRLNRRVALKFLSESLENDNAAKRRLVKEAQAVAMLEHPNICAVHGIEQTNEYHFIVMQFIEGKTLDESINNREITAENFENLARQIVTAVAFAHSHGVIHRDLKPGNIMLNEDGQIKVLDFGLAKVLPQKQLGGDNMLKDVSRLSQHGLIIGTVSYMSPEQLRGEKLDYRSDIFSVGIVLYELLAKKNPFDHKSQAETIAAILQSQPPVIDKSDFPEKYLNLVEKCLHKDKEKRFQSAAEILIELDKTETKSRNRSFSKIRQSFFAKAAFVAVILLAVLAAAFFYTEKSSEKTLAILPISFENPPPEKEYLADGLTQSIIDELSGLSDLEVKNEYLISRYKDKTSEPQTVGKELNADAVFTGSIVQRGDNLFLITKLTRTSDGFLMDTNEVKIEETNLIGLEKTVSERIIGKIKSNLTAEDKNKLQKRDTESTQAKNFYMQGRFHLKTKKNSDDLEKAIQAFINAKDIDQNYAEAWAGLADAYLLQAVPGVKGATKPEKAVERAKLAANKAIELDNTLSESYNSLGLINSKYEWNWKQAENYFRTAIALDPEFLPARFGLINVLKLTERYDEALKEVEKIKQFDPFSISSDIQIAAIYYRKHDYAKMDKILSELLQRFPDNRNLQYIRAYQLLKTSQTNGAIKILKQMYESNNENDRILAAAPLGFAYAKTGRRGEALKIIEDLEKFGKNNYVPAQEKALVYVGLGDYDKVFENLKSSCSEKFSALPGWINDPIVDEVKSDPRFAEIKKCVNL